MSARRPADTMLRLSASEQGASAIDHDRSRASCHLEPAALAPDAELALADATPTPLGASPGNPSMEGWVS